MLQIPDILPFWKQGALGVMVFLILVMGAVIAFLLKNQLSIGAPKVITREPTAGEKSAEWWKEEFENIENKGSEAIIKVLIEHHRAEMEMLGKLRARLRDSNNVVALRSITEFREKYNHDSIALVKILRGIEERLETDAR